MIENVFNDDLMCDITHRGYLFFFFAWFHASFAFLFLWEKFASFFGSVYAFASSGRRPLTKPRPVVIGELFVLCDGRITPVSLAKKNSLVSSSSSVVPSSSICPSSVAVRPASAAASSVGFLSSSVGPCPSVVGSPALAPSRAAPEPSPESVAFSSVFLSPSAVSSSTSEVTKQSFVLRSAPVLSDRMDRQGYLLDFARVVGLSCHSGGGLATIRQPSEKTSSEVSFGLGCEAITQALLAAGVVAPPVASVAAPVASAASPVASVAPPVASVAAPVASVASPVASAAPPVAFGGPPVASAPFPAASAAFPAASAAPPVASVGLPVASVATPAPCVDSPGVSVVAPVVSVSPSEAVVAVSAAFVAPREVATLESGFSWSSFAPSVTGPFVFGSSVCSSLPALAPSGVKQLVSASAVGVSAGPAPPVVCSTACSLPVSSAGESFFAKLAADEDEYLDSLAEEIDKLLDRDFDF
ncbi:uncharacterized protein EV154DRAFT_580413 [Mucor mucedo]|uniref:uncharacterized protein n=1 Tax=Mucor mucedo TaxID=29922 RepID=UPI00221F7A7C|nr:uncharacterized protein EV154DRAFT_580413 [Mucor mucedo]KAI7870906.1 hypothetical protein EV154DRAFT_580413 [Mucor mucedo]